MHVGTPLDVVYVTTYNDVYEAAAVNYRLHRWTPEQRAHIRAHTPKALRGTVGERTVRRLPPDVWSHILEGA